MKSDTLYLQYGLSVFAGKKGEGERGGGEAPLGWGEVGDEQAGAASVEVGGYKIPRQCSMSREAAQIADIFNYT